jgi:osmoprotectant transport system permease protein
VLSTTLGARPDVVIGSKKFTENVILGEIARGLAQSEGYSVKHREELGGTRVLFEAVRRGDIDLYPDYTGTILREILADQHFDTMDEARPYLAELGLTVSPPLGFNNTYAIVMKPETAAKYGIETISDLADHPDLRFGFGNEFMDRADGWPALKQTYDLPQTNLRGLDHDLAYRAIDADQIDVMDAYNTDAEIEYYGLKVLDDDRHHFPVYNALFVYRTDLGERAPKVVAALDRLGGTIDGKRMRAMNGRVKIEQEDESRVAADFLHTQFGIEFTTSEVPLSQRLLETTIQHLILVNIPLALGIAIAIPLGIVAAKRERTGHAILGAFGILQTIPSLALLALMIPVLGIGNVSAIAALTLYALLPLGRGAHAGMRSIPPTIQESAEALGLTPWQRLRHVELPLAGPAIMSGVKTAAVILIGFATLGALIGAGGYGQPILTGIRLDSTPLILEGAVPAAAMAILAQVLFEGLERLIVPRGLRLKRAT